MRKFIFLMVAALIMVFAASCTSCSNDAHFGIEYSLQSDGEADGNVNIVFYGGSFDLNGDADYALTWTNTILLTEVNAFPLQSALLSKNSETAKAANQVNDWVNENIKVSSAHGTYDIYIKGYVKETATGLIFAIDKHFTNIPDDDPTVDPD